MVNDSFSVHYSEKDKMDEAAKIMNQQLKQFKEQKKND